MRATPVLSRLRDARITTKIVATVAVAVLVAVAVGLLGLRALGHTADATDTMYRDELVGTVEVEAMRSQFFAIRLSGTNYAVASTPADRAKYLEAREKAYAELSAAAGRYLDTHPSAAGRGLVEQVQDAIPDYR